MPCEAKILADSISPSGHRLTTFLARFPRIVLAEVNTHKMLSKSSASSRAIPVETKIAAVEADMFIPKTFGRNQKGMQPGTALEGEEAAGALYDWRVVAECALDGARKLDKRGVHKQYANRLLEPFSWHTAVVSGTDWSNFWNLRVSPEAQGEFRDIAAEMKELYDAKKELRALNEGDWHLPFVKGFDDFDLRIGGLTPLGVARISSARCARVSYNTIDGKRDVNADLALYDRLVGPGHMAPLEHPARPMTEWEREAFKQYEAEFETPEGLRTMRVSDAFLSYVNAGHYEHVRLTSEPRAVYYCGNYNGWVQLRKLVPGEADIRGYRAAR